MGSVGRMTTAEERSREVSNIASVGKNNGNTNLFGSDAIRMIDRYGLNYTYNDLNDSYSIPNSEIERAIANGADPDYIKRISRQSGLKTSSRASTLAGRR